MSLNPFQQNLAWLWDIIAMVLSLISVMLVVQINGKIQQSGKLSTYVTRKIVHIMVAPVFLLTWFLFSGAISSRYIASIVPILFIIQFSAIGTGKMKDEAFVNSMSRSGDPAELLKGTLYYAIVILVVTIFWFYLPISENGNGNANPGAFVIIGCLAGGDGFADIIGRKFGGEKTFGIKGAKKTIVGSLAMFVASFIFSFGLIAIFSFNVENFNLNKLIIPILMISAVTTLIEAFSPPKLDNITIPAGVIIMIIIFSLIIPVWWPFPIISL